ncbi:MAG TPA: DHA2 family efflux MFS transporter permease subunit [Solirubrobacteraceae bacterium]|jgi:EmrB/QacA subfamily drug resistance transporter
MTPHKSRAVLAVTGAALFMITLDNLIVISALPAIGRGLTASLTELEWVVNAYVLAFAVLILTGAAIGERFGRRRVFVAGLAVFVLGSAAGGLAGTAGSLVAARAVQGVGAALLMPLTLTLLIAAFPLERRARALGVWSAISGLGVALGPVGGGLLTTGLSWHWIFWVNVPVGGAAMLAAPRVLDDGRGRREPLDLVGLGLASAGLLAVVWSTTRGNVVGWTAPVTVAGYLAGAGLLTAFVRWERRAGHPMLPLRLFEARAFSTANAAGFLLHFAMFGAFFATIEFLTHVRAEGPIGAGLWTLPWTVMPLLVSARAGRLGQRRSPAAVAAGGLGLIAAGALALAAAIGPSTAPAALAPGLLAVGVGVGLVLPNVAALAMGSVPAPDVGKASGTLNTARQLGAVFGLAVAVAVVETAGPGAGPLSEQLRVAAAAAGFAALVGGVLLAGVRPARSRRVAVPRRVAAAADEAIR